MAEEAELAIKKAKEQGYGDKDEEEKAQEDIFDAMAEEVVEEVNDDIIFWKERKLDK